MHGPEISVQSQLSALLRDEADRAAAIEKAKQDKILRDALQNLSFSNMLYTSNLTKQVVIGVGMVAATVVLVYTGAVPLAVGAVGTKIGALAGLSGIAAQNFGLALLGGGSIASGGLGIHGGTAVLAGLYEYTTHEVLKHSTTFAFDQFNQLSFREASKNYVLAPFPLNKSGSDAYVKAIGSLDSINYDEPIWSDFNKKVMRAALDNLGSNTDRTDYMSRALQSVIQLNIGDYDSCRKGSQSVIDEGKAQAVVKDHMTYIVAINALCLLGSQDTGNEHGKLVADELDIVLRNELNRDANKFAMMWVAAFFDRYFGRDDIMDTVAIEHALSYISFIEDPAIQYQYVLMIAGRLNFKLNQYASILKQGGNTNKGDIDFASQKYASFMRVAGDAAEAVSMVRSEPFSAEWSKSFSDDERKNALSILSSLSESLTKHAQSGRQVIEKVKHAAK